jgi:hydroxyacylglutathione hydrolase
MPIARHGKGRRPLQKDRPMPAQIRLFRCLSDNFGVLVHDPDTNATAAIDAPEAAPVETALKETGWTLTDILVTHHHADHTGGIDALKQKYRCRVVAPAGEAAKVPAVDETVREGDKVKVGKLSANVIETPGHTLGHIAYWFHGDKVAFVGDTLFSIGCGRVIEGTPAQMWESLKKLRDLPDDTAIYCGHSP